MSGELLHANETSGRTPNGLARKIAPAVQGTSETERDSLLYQPVLYDLARARDTPDELKVRLPPGASEKHRHSHQQRTPPLPPYPLKIKNFLAA